MLSCCISLAYVWQLHFRNIGHLYNTTQELQDRDEHLRSMLEKFEYGTPHCCHLNYLIMRHHCVSKLHAQWLKLTPKVSFYNIAIEAMQREDFLTFFKHCDSESYQYLNVWISEIHLYKDN